MRRRHAFFVAIQCGGYGRFSDVARVLFEAGADVEVTCTNVDLRFTPLHMAAALAGNEEALYALVTEFGADVDAKDMNGNTPLHIAAASGNCENVDELITYCGALMLSRTELAGFLSTPPPTADSKKWWNFWRVTVPNLLGLRIGRAEHRYIWRRVRGTAQRPVCLWGSMALM